MSSQELRSAPTPLQGAPPSKCLCPPPLFRPFLAARLTRGRSRDALPPHRWPEKGEVLLRVSALYDISFTILSENSACQGPICEVAA